MCTIDRIKKKFIEEGFEACLERRPTTRQCDKIADGETEAHLIALSCSSPPKGYGKWSLRLLADKLIEINYVEDVSHETVRRILKKRT